MFIIIRSIGKISYAIEEYHFSRRILNFENKFKFQSQLHSKVNRKSIQTFFKVRLKKTVRIVRPYRMLIKKKIRN